MRSGEKPEKGLARDKAFNSSDNRIETYQIPARTPPGFDMVSSRFTRASRAQDGGTFNESKVVRPGCEMTDSNDKFRRLFLDDIKLLHAEFHPHLGYRADIAAGPRHQ